MAVVRGFPAARGIDGKLRAGNHNDKLETMPAIKSRVDARSDEFKANAAFLQGQVDDLRATASAIATGSDPKSRERHVARGKLLPRDRVDGAARSGHAVPRARRSSPRTACTTTRRRRAGIITGIGRVAGREVRDRLQRRDGEGRHLLSDHGEEAPARAGDRAAEPPAVRLSRRFGRRESCRNQDDVFPDREHFGRIFYNQANMSRRRASPQIAVVMGSCTAGGAYVPAMSDETVIVKNQGTIFLGGPPLVKAATGEIVSAEELGGGDVHTRLLRRGRPSRRRRPHALAIARQHRRQPQPHASRSRSTVEASRASRSTTLDEIYGVIPADTRKPYDVREVIARIVDGSRARRVQGALRHDARHRLRPHLRHPVGIVANNGILFSESALKGAHFIELCCQRAHPARVPAEHHRLHGRQEVRERRHRAATARRWSPPWRPRRCPSSR